MIFASAQISGIYQLESNFLFPFPSSITPPSLFHSETLDFPKSGKSNAIIRKSKQKLREKLRNKGNLNIWDDEGGGGGVGGVVRVEVDKRGKKGRWKGEGIKFGAKVWHR